MSDIYVYHQVKREDLYVARTMEATVLGQHTGIMVDLDAEGQIIGVEHLDVDTVEVDGKPVVKWTGEVHELSPGAFMTVLDDGRPG